MKSENSEDEERELKHLREEINGLSIDITNSIRPESFHTYTLFYNSLEELMRSLEPCVLLRDYKDETQMAEIARLVSSVLTEPYTLYTYRYFIHSWPNLCILAYYKTSVVGVVVCKIDEHYQKLRGYIAMLAIDEKFRRRKIDEKHVFLATALTCMAIKRMIEARCDEVVLEAEVTNESALKLYEKLGFFRDKRLFRYYLSGADAFRLKLWLT